MNLNSRSKSNSTLLAPGSNLPRTKIIGMKALIALIIGMLSYIPVMWYKYKNPDIVMAQNAIKTNEGNTTEIARG